MSTTGTCIPGTPFTAVVINATILKMIDAPVAPLEYPAWDIALKVVFYLVAMLTDIVGNSIVLLIIALNKKMRTTTNVLILNLAVSDLMVASFCMWVHLGNKVTDNWTFGSFMCKFSAFTQVMSLTASVLTLTVISVERLIAVAYPFRQHWSPTVSAVIVGCTWVAAIATASPHLFVRKQYEIRWKDRTDVYCAESWRYYYKDTSCRRWQPGKFVYYIVEGVVMYFVPVTIMIAAYIVIAIKLVMRRTPGSRANTLTNQERSKKKVTKMLTVVLVSFIICWTPQQIMLLYEVFYNPAQTDVYTAVRYAALFVAYCNSALNPILYGGFNENFRKGFHEAFTCILIRKRNKIDTENGATKCSVQIPNNGCEESRDVRDSSSVHSSSLAGQACSASHGTTCNPALRLESPPVESTVALPPDSSA